MDNKLKPGIRLTLEKIVTPEESAVNMGSGSIEVLSTPSMIAFMERASMEAVQGYLSIGTTTVGTLVNIKHISPTKIGATIRCTTSLDEVDSKRLSFKVEAEDENGIIGTGTHERYIIDKAKFVNKLNG
jgi:predicted thioesterase